jgi:hypothetical protein
MPSNRSGGSQLSHTERGESGRMTNDDLRQRLPNRRFRRLLPAAVAAVTLAASALSVAHAAPRVPPRAAHAQPPGKIPTVPRVGAIRGVRVQGISAS